MKRICVCCDGTWNSPDETEDGKPASTNVVKLAEAIASQDKLGMRQLVYYEAGIGTSGAWLRRAFDGATGTGMSRNILEAYRYLIHTYEPGDELYFFGFSRGAFTVRSLAGLIRNSGLLRRDALTQVDSAYALYRSRAPGSHPRAREAVLFRRTYAIEEVTRIHLIGVWDTVGALGNPVRINNYLGLVSRRNQFHDTDLSSTVRYAYHAIAIDETRKQFAATLWRQPAPVPDQTLEQAWFAGAHSNVGGGYPATGLSDIALGWMIERARGAGLAIGAVLVAPDVMEHPGQSRTLLYRLYPNFRRPIDAVSDGAASCERIHRSVLEKHRRDDTYRPPNLLTYLAGPHGSDPPAE